MDLATARAIVADSSLAPTQADWMLAGRVLYDFWQKHPETLKPMRGGVMTTDAPKRKETLDDVVADIRRLRRKLTRGLTRDQAQPGRRLMKLDAPASAYRVATDPEGNVWLIEEGAQTGEPPPPADPDLMEASPARRMGPTGSEPWSTGDIARHRAATAARDRGAKFAEQFNANQRKHWGS